MKQIFILLFTFIALSFTHAQDVDFDETFQQAYVNADAKLWESKISTFKETNSTTSDSELLLQLAKAQYYATTSYLAKGNKEKAGDNLKEAETNLNTYLKANEKSGVAHALLSAIYGLQIGLSPMKGMTLGSKSSKHLDKALQYSPNDPFVLMLKGSNLYYTPAMWGGDSEEAINYLNKAKEAFEKQGNYCTIDWLNNMALLGQAYHYEEQLQDALSTYKTALNTSGNFGWVKYNLLPKLEKDM